MVLHAPGDAWRGRLSTLKRLPRPRPRPNTRAGGDGAMTYETSYSSSTAVQNGRARSGDPEPPVPVGGRNSGSSSGDQPFKTLDFWSNPERRFRGCWIFSARVDEPAIVRRTDQFQYAHACLGRPFLPGP